MGRIYFVEAHGANVVKIGYSEDVKSRIKALSQGSPHKLILLGTMEGNMQDEERLHQAFESQHVRGEWFKLSPQIKDFIRANTTKTYGQRSSRLTSPKTVIKKRNCCQYCGKRLPDKRHGRQVYCNETCRNGAAYQRKKGR